MKKILFIIFITTLTVSCKSNYEKTLSALKSQYWMIEYQEEMDSYGKIVKKKFENDEITIHKFNENTVSVYNYEGELENIFSYSTEKFKNDVIITVSNMFSGKDQKFKVIASDDMCVLLGRDGKLKTVQFWNVYDKNILEKLKKSEE